MSRPARLRALAGRCREDDAGNAIVEFLGLSFVLLIPVAYLLLTVGRLQAAVFATEAAAREAARVAVTSASSDDAVARARVAAGLALGDQGFDDDPAQALTLTCSAHPCLTPGADVSALVEVRVPLPFVPAFARDALPLEIPVRAERTAAVDELRAAR